MLPGSRATGGATVRSDGPQATGRRRDLYELAHERVGKLLSNHYPVYIDPAADAKIRERFPIALKPEDMRPGNGRW